MNTKSIISALLLLFICVSVIYLVVGDRREGRSTAITTTEEQRNTLQPDTSSETVDPSGRRENHMSTFVVYYFHRDFRCQTCIALEALSHQAIENGFPDELIEGIIEWRVVNVDEPENEHFVDRFQLYAQSLVIERYRDGKSGDWKNLEKIWDLLNDEEAFMTYVQGEVRTFLEES